MKLAINQIQSNIDNPRIIKSDKFKKLVNSIKEFPEMLELRPIVIDENNIILGGNMRYKACIEAGLNEVPVKIAKNLSEKQKQEFIVKDNINFGEWDWDILSNDWNSVQLTEWGLDVWENLDDKELKPGLIDDDDIPEVKESKVKHGDIWQLGKHRLMCGDSTKESDVEKLMNGQKADMVFTDPPYGVNYESNWRNKKSKKKFDIIENDNLILNIRPILDFFSTKKSSWYIWTSHQVYCQWLAMFSDIYINTIIWNKGKMGMGDLSSYGNNYEMCIFSSYSKPKLKGERKKAIWEINIDSGAKYR